MLNGKRYRTIYMSLYGISNLEEISKKIFIETTQLMDKNLKKYMDISGQNTIPEYDKTGLDKMCIRDREVCGYGYPDMHIK